MGKVSFECVEAVILTRAKRSDLQIQAYGITPSHHVREVGWRLWRTGRDAVRQVAPMEKQAVSGLDLDGNRCLLGESFCTFQRPDSHLREVLEDGSRPNRDGTHPAIVASPVCVPTEAILSFVTYG